MADLIAISPCAGLLPKDIGHLTIDEVDVSDAVVVAPFAGRTKEVSAALKEQLGIAFPGANRSTSKGHARAIWFGAGQALIMSQETPDVGNLAAVTAQGDGLAAVTVSGEDALEVLARLVPIDLRAASFKRGHTARSLVNHMTATITRIAADRFEIITMRSMAQTLVSELEEAALSVKARRETT